MRCTICKKGVTRQGTTTITLERDCLTMVIKEVPAQVCPICKGAYIDEKITADLLRGAEERVREGVQVEIRQYVAA